MNSYLNFVHEIRNFWWNLEKVHSNSREFVKVMLRMACTVRVGSLLNRDFVAVKWQLKAVHELKFANFLGLFTYENPKRRSDIYIR